MTAEEYLNEHCKPEDWNNLEECLKDSILTNNVIEHMERYAALRIHDVVGRSEQCCSPTDGFYLGTTCPHCNKPFRKDIR
jgi:hypothetical protein